MFNITSQRGNTNQKHNEIPLRTHQDSCNQKQIVTSVVEDGVKLGISSVASGKVEWCRLCKPVWQFLKRLNIELTYNPAIPFQNIYLREMKIYVHIKSYKRMFRVAPKWEKPKWPSADTWINEYGINKIVSPKWNIVQP